MVQKPKTRLPARVPRRAALKYGLAGLGCAACGGAGLWHLAGRLRAAAATGVFPGDAPAGRLWELWQQRGWAREARHYVKLGRNMECKLCPNECLLEPEDRGHCRNRVNKDGKLYTLAYSNPCAWHVRSDREEAAVPLPARHRRLLARHGRLRPPLPELPELGNLAEQARRNEGPAGRAVAAGDGGAALADPGDDAAAYLVAGGRRRPRPSASAAPRSPTPIPSRSPSSST